MSIHRRRNACGENPERELYVMSDEQSTEATEVQEQEAPDTNVSVEKLKADLDKWKSLSRKNEDRARENAEAAKAWAAHQESNKSAEEKREAELEKLRAELTEARNSVAAKDRAILVERVAASKGVPARYLAGDSEEDLVASADQFLEDAKTLNKPVGYVPSQGEGEPTPAAASLETGAERARAYIRK